MSRGKARILGIFGIIAILLSSAFTAIPIIPSNALNVVRLIARQRTIEQIIVKDCLLLAYGTSSERIQALSELQDNLPMWEQVETALQNGDASLGISSHLPGDISTLVLQAQPDFTSIDIAAHHILSHPSPVDQTQLAIILQHESSYSVTIFQLNGVYDAYLQEMAQVYFSIGVGVDIILFFIWLRFFRALLKHIPKEEEKP
jgi:hypothetical protein